MSNKEIKTIITHNGKFHADDVCAVSTLLLVFPDAKVVRTRDEALIASGDVVLDVGQVYDPEAYRFDHHQKDGAGERENGIPYASFGLIWKHFGRELCKTESVWQKIDESLVQSIDAHDSGIDIFSSNNKDVDIPTLSVLIGKFNPTWKEDENSFDQIFMDLIPFVQNIIRRYIKRAEDSEEAIDFVEKAYQSADDKRLIVLDDGYPWKEVLVQKTEPLLVVYPNRVTDNWHIQVVPMGVDGFENRISMPNEWGGLTGEDFSNISGVPDAHFCHSALFLAVSSSKEGALLLADKILKNSSAIE